MSNTTGTDVSYDPYNVETNADPYGVYRRLREEVPLYRNDEYDFFALSRFDDVENALVDRETYISGRGAIVELIKADMDIPPGVIIFEDPPIHTVHRGLLPRVHAQEDGRARAADPGALCSEPGSAGSAGCLRLHRRSGRADADAGDRQQDN